jgi:hypothetical protein
LGEYAGVDDSWMDVISSQGSSLLSVDLSGSDVTDFGLIYLKDCQSLISLNLNYCDQISDRGLECISGILSIPVFFQKHIFIPVYVSLLWNNIHLFLIFVLGRWFLGILDVYFIHLSIFTLPVNKNISFILLK